MRRYLRHFNLDKRLKSGFTIVELLVVVVIIAVLAAISLVMYTGISQKAVASVLQSDLSNAATAIKAFQVENANFPTTISTNCSSSPDTTTNKCLRLSSGNAFAGYSVDNSSSPKTFQLFVSNGSQIFKVTSGTAPTQLASASMQPGVTPGADVELHAARANGGVSQGINSPLTTTWADTSGSANSGTLYNFSGSPWSGAGTFANPYGLTFNGTNTYIAMPSHPSTTLSALTLESWYKASAQTSGMNRYVIANGNNAAQRIWVTNVGTYDMVIGAFSPSFTYNVNDGNMHHLLQVWDGSGATIKLYDNNSLVKTYVAADGVPSSITMPTGPWYVGAWYDSYGYISSFLPAVRIYPFALNSSQISANYNAGPDW